MRLGVSQHILTATEGETGGARACIPCVVLDELSQDMLTDPHLPPLLAIDRCAICRKAVLQVSDHAHVALAAIAADKSVIYRFIEVPTSSTSSGAN